MADRHPRKRGLPPAALAILYFAIVLTPILLAAGLGGGHRVWTMRVSVAAGMAAGAMVKLQMISSGRFEAISGRIGIDVTMGYHKWAAPIALAFAVLHVAFFVGLPNPDRPHQIANRFDTVISGPALLGGRVVLILLALLVALALLRARLPVRYEVWRATHAVGAVALIAGLLWHVVEHARSSATLWFWVLLALVVLLPASWVYARRLFRPASSLWRVAAVRKEAERLWRVEIEPTSGQTVTFEAGQFAWITIGDTRLPLFDHPFSIASTPRERRMSFLIQESGDFSGAMSEVRVGTQVSIDAPHGSFGVRFQDGPIILVAGGVGVAPILSLLHDLAQRGTERPVRLLYAARSEDAMIPRADFEDACERLGITPILISDQPSDRPDIRPGPVRQEHLKDLLDGLDAKTAEALVCGPPAMMTFVSNTLAGLGVPVARIDYERFSYSAGQLSSKDRRMLAGFVALWAAILGAVFAYSFL